RCDAYTRHRLRYYLHIMVYFVFFFNPTATPDIYTLSLHDALPISSPAQLSLTVEGTQFYGSWYTDLVGGATMEKPRLLASLWLRDRKSTRLNSSHDQISYAVFCLKKKKNT